MTDYTFSLTGGGQTRICHPIYGNGLAMRWRREEGRQFFRRTLEGELTFNGADFAWIMSISFDEKITLVINYKGSEYWIGSFHRADGTVNVSSQTFRVSPLADDGYEGILSMLDNEYNLTELPISTEKITYDIRPMVQMAVVRAENTERITSATTGKVSCFIGSVGWDAEIDARNVGELTSQYHFQALERYACVYVPEIVTGIGDTFIAGVVNIDLQGYFHLNMSDEGHTFNITVTDNSNYIALAIDGVNAYGGFPGSTASKFPGAPADYPNTIVFLMDEYYAMARLLTNKENSANSDALPDDLNPRNYKYCRPLNESSLAFASSIKSSTPTPYGQYKDGIYYAGVPSVAGAFQPLARDSWGLLSWWFPINGLSDLIDVVERTSVTLRDAYTLQGVIQAILDAGGSGLVFDNQSSRFFFGDRPIIGAVLDFFLTAKTNVKVSSYTIAAKKVPITLGGLLDVLEKIFRVFWYIEDGRLHIEHIRYFMQGGSYTSIPDVGIDLTEAVSKNGKMWAFGQDEYKWDKLSMPERYEFGWMDEVSTLFKGLPMEMLGGFVEKGKVDKFDVTNMTTDIDTILGNPADISDDGLVMFACRQGAVAYYAYQDQHGNLNMLQNGYLSFAFLQELYAYDLPCETYKIGDRTMSAIGVKRNRTQSVVFPAENDIDVQQLIRTRVGDGQIDELSINLSSRRAQATLKFEND